MEGPADAEEPEDVFNGKEDGEEPFQLVEQGAVGQVERSDTVEHHDDHAQDDAGDQQDVEGLAAEGFGAEDDFMQLLAPGGYVWFLLIGHFCSALLLGFILEVGPRFHLWRGDFPGSQSTEQIGKEPEKTYRKFRWGLFSVYRDDSRKSNAPGADRRDSDS